MSKRTTLLVVVALAAGCARRVPPATVAATASPLNVPLAERKPPTVRKAEAATCELFWDTPRLVRVLCTKTLSIDVWETLVNQGKDGPLYKRMVLPQAAAQTYVSQRLVLENGLAAGFTHFVSLGETPFQQSKPDPRDGSITFVSGTFYEVLKTTSDDMQGYAQGDVEFWPIKGVLRDMQKARRLEGP